MKNDVYILGARGPWYAVVGIFSSTKKASAAWKEWKIGMRGTEWGRATKEIEHHKVDELL